MQHKTVRSIDITSTSQSTISKHLNWVGMENIAIPLRVKLKDGSAQTVTSQLDVLVSLDDQQAKGIHMSRLYLLANETLANQMVTEQRIEQLLYALVNSQQGLSLNAKLVLRFELMLEKLALKASYQASILYR